MTQVVDQCNFCGASGARHRCHGCGQVWYCSKQHQEADADHKAACLYLKTLSGTGVAWEGDVKPGEYAGTYKWSHRRDFTQLPAWCAAPLDSWESYLGARMADTPDQEEPRSDSAAQRQLVVDPAMLDGLSFPLSLLYALRQLLTVDGGFKDGWMTGSKELSILALGCSERAEEHVLRHTNYFTELAHYLPRFKTQLWLVGPEMSASDHLRQRSLAPNLTATTFRGTTAAFLSTHTELGRTPGPTTMSPSSTAGSTPAPPPPPPPPPPSSAAAAAAGAAPKVLVIAYNTGMASGDTALRESWAADLEGLLLRGWPCVFTCANDHTDLKGERQLLEKQLKVKYALYPRKNPFAAVTTLHPPGQRDSGWYAANAFIYVVCGVVAAAPCAQHATSTGGQAGAPAQGIGVGKDMGGAADSKGIPQESKAEPQAVQPGPAQAEVRKRVQPGQPAPAAQPAAAVGTAPQEASGSGPVRGQSVQPTHQPPHDQAVAVVQPVVSSHPAPGSTADAMRDEAEAKEEEQVEQEDDLFLPD